MLVINGWVLKNPLKYIFQGIFNLVSRYEIVDIEEELAINIYLISTIYLISNTTTENGGNLTIRLPCLIEKAVKGVGLILSGVSNEL